MHRKWSIRGIVGSVPIVACTSVGIHCWLCLGLTRIATPFEAGPVDQKVQGCFGFGFKPHILHHIASSSGILSLSCNLVSWMEIAVKPFWVISCFQALNQELIFSLFCGQFPKPRLRTFWVIKIISSFPLCVCAIVGCWRWWSVSLDWPLFFSTFWSSVRLDS